MRELVTGSGRKLNPRPILGYTDRETVKLDFDETSFKIVKYWALRACKWFKLSGFIVFESSPDHFHVIFDRKVSWTKNVHVMSWVATLSVLHKLKDYVLMQCIKEASTIRIGPKKGKPAPREIYVYGSQEEQITIFLNEKKALDNLLSIDF